MGEEYQGGVCGGTWWNPSLFSGGGGGGGGGFSSPCSVAQLGGGYDMGSFGWPYEIMKGKSNNQVCDYNNNNLIFSADFDSTFDILGSSLSPTTSTTNWNQENQFCKGGSNEENYDPILLQDNLSSSLNYQEIEASIQTMTNSTKFPSQDGSPPTTMTPSTNNSPGDSSTITCEGGLTTSFPINSSASYLIQTLFDDNVDEPQVPLPQPMFQLINPNNYGSMDHSQVPHSLIQPLEPTCLQLHQSDKFDGGMNMFGNGGQLSNGDYNTATTLSNIRASLLNSLQSRSRATTFNHKSHNCGNLTTKLKQDARYESKKNMNNDEPIAKRPRIETPSSLPTFKVRKEKLGDRITALQQLVSPFGKTDTASVLHEAIEYIKFLHDQVHVLSTPYLKNGAVVQHHQVMDDNEQLNKQDLRSRGLCLVPISSTYPVTQETTVDFWTPTFGGTTFG